VEPRFGGGWLDVNHVYSERFEKYTIFSFHLFVN